MVIFDLTMNKQTITIDDKFKKAFSDHTYLFYALDETEYFFTNFMFVDIEAGNIKTYRSSSESNKEKLRLHDHKLPEYKTWSNKKGTHTCYKLGPDVYLNLPEDASPFIRVIDLRHNKMYAYTHDDLGLNDHYVDFNSTLKNYRDDDIYIACSKIDKGIDFFKFTYEITEDSFIWHKPQYIATDPEGLYAPHDILVTQSELIGSKFQEMTYTVNDMTFYTDIDFYQHIEQVILNDFKTRFAFICNEDDPKFKVMFKKFKNNLYTKYPTWLDIIDQYEELDYTIEKGKLTLINLDTNKVSTIFSSSTPAHVEYLDDALYVSHHNFMLWFATRGCFVGSGGMDKFIKDDTNEYVNTVNFREDTAYRLISSKFFEKDNKNYFIMIGHPGKFFVVSCDDMQLKASTEIIKYHENKSVQDINVDLTNRFTARFTNEGYSYRTFEISVDGDYLLTLDLNELKILKMPENIDEECSILFTHEYAKTEHQVCDSSHSDSFIK